MRPSPNNDRNHTTTTNNNNSVNSTALMAITKALRSETDYRSAVKKINANAMILAESLSHSGVIEQTLIGATDAENGGEEERQNNADFLEQQRVRLKALVARNVRSERTVAAFVESVNELKEEVRERERKRKRRWTEDELEGDDEGGIPEEEEPPNYEDVIRSKMEVVKRAQEQNSVAIEDEVWTRRCREKLGEKDPRGVDDEDLEVMTQPGASQSQDSALRCKLTLQRFVRPFRNKLCNHVYEHQAIMQYLKTKKACPMPGCNNQNMTEAQFEEDEEIIMKVRRLERREEEEKKARAKARESLDDEYDDEGGGVGVTMID